MPKFKRSESYQPIKPYKIPAFLRRISVDILDDQEKLNILVTKLANKKKLEKETVGLGRMISPDRRKEELEPRELAIKEGFIVLNINDWTLEKNMSFILNNIESGKTFGLWNNLNEKESELLDKKLKIEDLNKFFLDIPVEKRLKEYPILSNKEEGVSITARELSLLQENGYERSSISVKGEGITFKIGYLRSEDKAFKDFKEKHNLEDYLVVGEEQLFELQKAGKIEKPIMTKEETFKSFKSSSVDRKFSKFETLSSKEAKEAKEVKVGLKK